MALLKKLYLWIIPDETWEDFRLDCFSDCVASWMSND